MKRNAPDFWWQPSFQAWLLWPISWLYRLLTSLRRLAYRIGLFKRYRAPVPVIVVGGILVGGSGKTPFTLWLVELLRKSGYQPGVVLRGYGGKSPHWPRRVEADSDPAQVGDEAVLIARRTGVPVCAGPKRRESVQHLVEQGCDVIVSDDGLQHYALDRNIEIAVVDGRRRFGNRMLLPAGPLREPISRLNKVHWVISNGPNQRGEYRMDLRGDVLKRLDGAREAKLTAWQGRAVHALAGIGDPRRFFATLRRAGLQVQEHPFPDHHDFTGEDLNFTPPLPLVMTEKDAVKCIPLAPPDADLWYLPVSAKVDARLERLILKELESL
ncbi:MAG: tetraacyldisaccharide 4'-kinase [Gammaproteobacteria bacterium]|nr:tetraacyldisaccharide 4'-kinase [Gammaproteobacteria bacterium]MCP5135202.1 tetraacyldisaccharide 4'-kinase [Gammaproteobacteria bacterium]